MTTPSADQRRHHLHTEGWTIRWARLYDVGTTLLSAGRLPALHRKIVEIAGISPGERVLDVGCGPGRLTLRAARAAGAKGEVCGIDPAHEMVELARRKAARAGLPVHFEVAAIESLPFPEASFDVVLSSMMLHHLPDELKRRGLGEVRRVLKPGGRFVAVDFGAIPGPGLGHLLCILGLRRGREHAERLAAMFRDAGMEAVEIGPSLRNLAFVRGQKRVA